MLKLSMPASAFSSSLNSIRFAFASRFRKPFMDPPQRLFITGIFGKIPHNNRECKMSRFSTAQLHDHNSARLASP
jgi:hypothetical protein